MNPHAIAQHMDESAIVAIAFKLANAAVVSDIESNACKVQVAGATWYDIRPMLDPREHASEAIDMAGLAIGYALCSGVIFRHPEQTHLVRLPLRLAHL